MVIKIIYMYIFLRTVIKEERGNSHSHIQWTRHCTWTIHVEPDFVKHHQSEKKGKKGEKQSKGWIIHLAFEMSPFWMMMIHYGKQLTRLMRKTWNEFSVRLELYTIPICGTWRHFNFCYVFISFYLLLYNLGQRTGHFRSFEVQRFSEVPDQLGMAILSVIPENPLRWAFLTQNFNLGIAKISGIPENPVLPNPVYFRKPL